MNKDPKSFWNLINELTALSEINLNEKVFVDIFKEIYSCNIKIIVSMTTLL